MSGSMYGRPPAAAGSFGGPKSHDLCIYNHPEEMSESELYSYFPTAVNISFQPNSSSSCLIQFQSDADCQAAFTECQNGKLVGGRPVQAQIVASNSSEHSGNSGGGFSSVDHSRVGYGDSGSRCSRDYGGSYPSQSSDCTLTLRNLAWSVTEADLIGEFPRAINTSVKMDERNRSRGWGTVTFANPTDCRNAEAECSNKSINGRPVRAEIRDPSERFREDNYRGGRGGGRPFHDRYDGGGGGRRGGGGMYGGDGMQSRRRSDDVNGDNERRSWGGDYSGQRRGAGGGFDRDRRDRSPGRRRGGGGSGGGGGGARITSAVIRRAPGDSSDSDFDNRG